MLNPSYINLNNGSFGSCPQQVYNYKLELQKKIIEKIFRNNAISRYTELLFHPDLMIKTGSVKNFIGKIDALLSGSLLFKKIFARQEAFIINKKV